MNTDIGAERDDASRHVLDAIEADRRPAARSVELLADVPGERETGAPVVAVTIDRGSGFIDTRPCLGHDAWRRHHENGIRLTLRKVGRPQSNDELERVYRTDGKQRRRIVRLDESLTFHGERRPLVSRRQENPRQQPWRLTHRRHRSWRISMAPSQYRDEAPRPANEIFTGQYS